MEQEFGRFSVERLVTGMWKENCYLVKDQESNELTIIDPGGDAQVIAGKLEQSVGTVRHILLTHGHYDHFGAASDLCELTGVPCSLHQGDIKLLRRAPLYAMSYERKNFKIPGDIAVLSDVRTLDLGGCAFQVLETPGHTSGSVCFQFGSFIFTGDTLLNGTVGRTDLPGGNSEQLSNSMEYLLTNLAEDTVVLPGHGRPWTGKEAQEWWKGRRTTSVGPTVVP
jgi:glyoxylase-like metal-dependent hydrolase (beta-lactamase superfamily II)